MRPKQSHNDLSAFNGVVHLSLTIRMFARLHVLYRSTKPLDFGFALTLILTYTHGGPTANTAIEHPDFAFSSSTGDMSAKHCQSMRPQAHTAAILRSQRHITILGIVALNPPVLRWSPLCTTSPGTSQSLIAARWVCF